jgi:1-deoxy-D-xylulose-5-phosphate reductoisomerase
MKKIIILGSTGSIGSSLISIINKDKKIFKIVLLTANKNYKKIIKQTKHFKVRNIILTNKKSYLITKKILKDKKINIYNNFDNLDQILKGQKIDYTMSAISGFDGLKPTLDIIKFTRVIAIANKESIICGWNLIKKNLQKHKTKFIPVDSEHFSIWSIIGSEKNSNFEKVFLTASGGPFQKYPLNLFHKITTNMALKHPNWVMGKKISIDSATMMNKVFEIIEAKKIFNLKYNQLDILIHPHSYLHAIVKFKNGLIKFLVHDTDMRIPIFNSLYSSIQKNIKSKKLNIKILNNLSLERVDSKRFPVVNLIKKLSDKDTLFETVIVAANDRLVYRFLNNKIKFIDISIILLKVLALKEFTKYNKIYPKKIDDIEQLSKLVSLKIDTISV